MDIITYIVIFMLKLIENTFATLRLILVANGKKFVGAILMFITALIWVLSVSIVVIDFNDDYLKIVIFALGSGVGSLIGSLIEEQFSKKTYMLSFTTDYYYYKLFINLFDKFNKKTYKYNSNNYHFEIICSESEKKGIIKAIKNNNSKLNIIITQINCC